MKKSSWFNFFLVVSIILIISPSLKATNYSVSSLAELENRMSAAVQGDTVIVMNGTYNWGRINLTNTRNSPSSDWIVLKAQSFNNVLFTGNTYLQFSGTRIHVTGFRFTGGNAGTASVIQFRNSSNIPANYCRVSNITIDHYNSDSSGAADPANPGVGIDNKRVSLYGTNNRLDHCTFINKFNAGATVVVWYDGKNGAYPGQSTSTYHRIDSNYFNGRGYKAGNGGESIRIGTSQTSTSHGYNLIEYNLFENMVQTEPEIISNKTSFNTYRYNTFKNCSGGLTLRHARYCNVYGNFFIVDNPAVTNSYGIRIIDKGHRVFNNYIEGVNGNSGSLTSLRCPIILYNGQYSVNDTLNPAHSSGYWPSDSSIVAFNTIVNCKGGAGVVIAHTDNNTLPFQPLGLVIANNAIKMATGQAVYKDPLSASATYFSEGNVYNAPSGLGNIPASGFSSANLTFGARENGILTPPLLLQDAAINTIAYSALLNGADALGQTRNAVFDIGADEVNGSGPVIAIPLDATHVGAGNPPNGILPVQLISFQAFVLKNDVHLQWKVENESCLKNYSIEYSNDGISFNRLAIIAAANQSSYRYIHPHTGFNKLYFRLKLIDSDGRFSYSRIILLNTNEGISVNIYPNPAKEFIVVDVLGIDKRTFQISLFNGAGQEVKRIKGTENSIKILLKDLAKGLYYLQLVFKNDHPVFYPFMIQ